MPSITHFDVADDSIGIDESITLSIFSDETVSPPDSGFNQGIYSESELGDSSDFDEDTNDYSQPGPRNPFTDGEAEDVKSSWESFNVDAGTLIYGSEEKSLGSLFLFQHLNKRKRRRVVIFSCESDLISYAVLLVVLASFLFSTLFFVYRNDRRKSTVQNCRPKHQQKIAIEKGPCRNAQRKKNIVGKCCPEYRQKLAIEN